MHYGKRPCSELHLNWNPWFKLTGSILFGSQLELPPAVRLCFVFTYLSFPLDHHLITTQKNTTSGTQRTQPPTVTASFLSSLFSVAISFLTFPMEVVVFCLHPFNLSSTCRPPVSHPQSPIPPSVPPALPLSLNLAEPKPLNWEALSCRLMPIPPLAFPRLFLPLFISGPLVCSLSSCRRIMIFFTASFPSSIPPSLTSIEHAFVWFLKS